jgi:hypothetical protein
MLQLAATGVAEIISLDSFGLRVRVKQAVVYKPTFPTFKFYPKRGEVNDEVDYQLSGVGSFCSAFMFCTERFWSGHEQHKGDGVGIYLSERRAIELFGVHVRPSRSQEWQPRGEQRVRQPRLGR